MVADQADIVALDADAALWLAIELLNTRNLDGVPVAADGVLLGAVTRASASEVIRARWPDATPARGRRRR
jgi:CBS domain-containing protein